jgi:hypothetical protein
MKITGDDESFHVQYVFVGHAETNGWICFEMRVCLDMVGEPPGAESARGKDTALKAQIQFDKIAREGNRVRRL